MRVSRLIAALALVCACGRTSAPSVEPGSPEDLAAYLRMIAGADETTRRHEVGSWILDGRDLCPAGSTAEWRCGSIDELSWHKIVVDPFRSLWSAYAGGFDAATEPLVAQLASAGAITARRHFAGDPALTLAQARLRWALPVLYPSVVATLAGAPIDTVFVFDGARWRVLAGLDELVLARVRALDAACADRLARAGPTGHCTEIGFVIADTALRGDRERFTHACALAVTLCGNRSP